MIMSASSVCDEPRLGAIPAARLHRETNMISRLSPLRSARGILRFGSRGNHIGKIGNITFLMYYYYYSYSHLSALFGRVATGPEGRPGKSPYW